MNSAKIISVALIIILVANITLFALRKIGVYLFWLAIIAAAVIAYWGIPHLREKQNK